jgi:hypothetical protein
MTLGVNCSNSVRLDSSRSICAVDLQAMLNSSIVKRDTLHRFSSDVKMDLNYRLRLFDTIIAHIKVCGLLSAYC